jgi:hypothetical protein
LLVVKEGERGEEGAEDSVDEENREREFLTSRTLSAPLRAAS